MEKNRLEAFSDGVLAIIITIMILELKQPAGGLLQDLLDLGPVVMAYVLSFFFIAIYWVNHHLIFHEAERININILWCNIVWLFCYVVYSVCNSLGRHIPDINGSIGTVFCRHGIGQYHVSPDVLSDTERKRTKV